MKKLLALTLLISACNIDWRSKSEKDKDYYRALYYNTVKESKEKQEELEDKIDDLESEVDDLERKLRYNCN